MAKKDDPKKLERRMRMLLMEKEVPQAKMDLVKTLMNNRSIKPEERYRTIIELIQSCPDKKTRFYTGTDEQETRENKKRIKGELHEPGIKKEPPAKPTDKSYYIDDLNRKYRLQKLFRKRCLVHRSNRFGIGFRKRLIPSKKLYEIIKYISTVQENVNSRLPEVLTAILDDPDVEDPTFFNYIRVFRKWMMVHPLAGKAYDEIKWMDREAFEREFKPLVKNYYSFMAVDNEVREGLVSMIESKLRGLDELKKFEIHNSDSGESKRKKEKSNLAREKEIYEYITGLRFFLPAGTSYESSLTRELYEKYSVDSLDELLESICEALIFQRPVMRNDIVDYFKVRAPSVSSETWDYNLDYLKKVGKDPESKKRKLAENLRDELEPLDMIYKLLASEKEERSFLLYGVSQQMKFVENRTGTPEDLREKNFLLFMDKVLSFFSNTYIPLLNGTEIAFRDPGRIEITGSLFSFSVLEGIAYSYKKVLDGLHDLRTSNPTLAVTRDEVKRVSGGLITTMPRVRELIQNAGHFFYSIATELKKHYELHRRWVFNGKNLTVEDSIRKPLEEFEIDPGNFKDGKPFPFFDCAVIGFEERPRLAKEVLNYRVIEDSLKGGLVVRITAFCYQAAFECFNIDLGQDLARRKELKRNIEKLSE